jgi:Na+/H+-dicarboxylate symporter
MRLVRVIWFLISVIIGVAVGLAYGWLMQPARYANTTPDTLRADYKTDYTLMVAEIYKKEGSVALAVHRLSQISTDPPVRLVQQAILTGRQLDYSSQDMDMLARLAEVLQTWTPASTRSNP